MLVVPAQAFPFASGIGTVVTPDAHSNPKEAFIRVPVNTIKIIPMTIGAGMVFYHTPAQPEPGEFPGNKDKTCQDKQ
jgi:hypothetical protein